MIHVHKLTKVYKLYDKPIDRLRESLSLRKIKRHKEFFALKNISFSVKKGEVVGILGKNGSGKSTLLKLITGVLTPTSGMVNTAGKITALLELGAGFNPELSGLENLHLSGVISGFSKQTMDKKIKEICEFADIGDFLYQPIKTYSSGMKARLGFAMAISVDPQILIVDEALSVGDVAFQRKCYAKIEYLCKEKNKTVLFVSHSEGIVKQLCDRAILLHAGQIVIDGNAKDVANLYNKMMASKDIDIKSIQSEFKSIKSLTNKPEIIPKKNTSFFNPNFISKSLVNYDTNGAKIYDVILCDDEGKFVNIIEQDRYYTFSYKIKFFEDFNDIKSAMRIKTKTGINIGGKGIFFKDKSIQKVKKDEIYELFWSFENILNVGDYFFNCGVSFEEFGERVVLHRILDTYMCRVVADERKFNGLVDLAYNLQIKKIDE
jgi:lipopolysaccharide transport system ATP-binding protein